MTEVRRRARGQLPVKAASPELGSVIVMPNEAVSVAVFGKPAPQGSKTPMGHEDNPRTRPWREMIRKVCEDGLPAGWVPLDGPLDLELWFFFDRPPSVSKDAMPCTRATYDWDKLSRAAGDGLTDGGVLVDDARIVDAVVRKRFVGPGEQARMVALVSTHRG